MKDANVHFMALVKEGERYIFIYDGPQSIDALLRHFAKLAADPELSFSWYDAAVMSQRVRLLKDKAQQ